ncbi:MAG TPA: hypothetical protein PLV68_11655, partial [Ilumatobacteraceae bacterium]|nr:hypothetical protein [Ilumatobacteraceae bacterium]
MTSVGAVLVGRWLTAADPLSPVDQDPDVVRDQACRLVESSSFCSPPKAPTRLPEASTGGGAAVGIGSIILWIVLVVALATLVWVVLRAVAGRGGFRRRRTAGEEDTEADDVVLDGEAT